MTRTTADPYDELAAMYLTEPDDRSEQRITPTAELLLVGHLPVRASLWLGPYADAVARESGATALVRLDGEEALVQLLGGDAIAAAPFAGARSLRELLLALAGHVDRWIVRPASQTSAVDLIDARADRITLLSSADQAALVHAYRIIKEIATAADHADIARPAVGAALLGVELDRARDAVARLSSTTGAYLDIDVPLVCALPRIDATAPADGIRSFPGQTRPMLGEVMGWIRAARHQPEAEGGAVRAPAPLVEAPPMLLDVEDMPPAVAPVAPAAQAAPVAPAAPVPPPPVEGLTLMQEIASGASAAPPAAAPPKPTIARPAGPVSAPAPPVAVELEPKHPAAHREPDAAGRPVSLASYVPGLRPVEARCPDHERVEIAIDDTGRLHIVAAHAELRSLPVVERWATVHRELIALACSATIDVRRRPVLHLFTEDALAVSDLHGGAFAIHLLAPVDVDGRAGWYVTTIAAAPGALPAGPARGDSTAP